MKNIFSKWQNLHFGHRRRVVLLSVLVGTVATGTTILVFLGVEYASFLLQTVLMGVRHPTPSGEQLIFPILAGGTLRPWLVVLLPTLGGLLGGWLVFTFAIEARGHAIDSTIRAFHKSKGRIPLRIPMVRALAAVLTIGSGGSAGRIGPIAHLGAGIGSWLATRLNLTAAERRTLAIAGCAAGIGAICRAPLGGALVAVEILYKDDFESSAILPCIVSSVTAYSLFMWFLSSPLAGSHTPTIHTFPDLTLKMPFDLAEYLVLAVICGLLGRAFVALFNLMRNRLFGRLPTGRILRCGLGGLSVGLLGLLSVESLGGGFGYLQWALDTTVEGMAQREILILMGHFLSLALLKMLATTLTVGSGCSGGLFGPSLLIGGLVGAAVGSLFHAFFPATATPPLAGFVVIGMGGFFAAVANAPIGAVILVSEMTGTYKLLPPLLLTCITSFLLLRHQSLYESQPDHQ